MISVFDLFKIGIGPSSSHTTGPMRAARHFMQSVATIAPKAHRIDVVLHGSLAWTGTGHHTHEALCLGLLGHSPERVDPELVPRMLDRLRRDKAIALSDGASLGFDPSSAILCDLDEVLPEHSNGMRFRLLDTDDSVILERVYYSPGGGFIVIEGEAEADDIADVPYPFSHTGDMLKLARDTGLSIAELQRANERAQRTDAAIDSSLDAIRDTMFACMDRGLSRSGTLPGGLGVERRAMTLKQKLLAAEGSNKAYPHDHLDWVSAFAVAVNEENASGGRVVTAPTNGAAGVVPAVLRYYQKFFSDYSDDGARDFLLTAAAIGVIIKSNASISGAEVGCQGEIGSAAAMAAAGLACVSGGTPEQIENAAEIALEHHLGLTCDPVGGLVQIPCIERNAIGAHKAIAAASLALHGDGKHRVSLDQAIESMRQTGLDMRSDYKETARGGLAVNFSEC